MSFEPGTVFAGDYRIERPLSSGGMGAVFVVRQLSTGHLRALKVMHNELVYDPESLRRFQQEASIGSRIASEHVVEVQAAGVDPATRVPFLVMELLEGEDLASRLRRGPLPPGEAFTVLEQLAHALGAAHEAGVVHRDLKPANVFLAVSRRTGSALVVKVLDFGIAKLVEDGRRTTAAFGTPLWLAPEQTRAGEITAAADVWAFGLLAFTMLVGRSFWRSAEGVNASVGRVMHEILDAPLPLASSRAAEYAIQLPAGFDGWFARAVARDPADRFPNARVAFAALAPLLRPAAAPVAPGPRTPTAVAPVPPRARGSGILVGILAGALVVFAAAMVAGFFLYPRVVQRAAPDTRAGSASVTPGAIPAPPPETTQKTAATAPAPTAAPAAPVARVGVMVMTNDHDAQDAAERQINLTLAPKLDACVATDAGAAPHGSLVVMVRFGADGRAISSQSVTPVSGRDVQCLSDTLKSITLPAAKNGRQLTFYVTWSPR